MQNFELPKLNYDYNALEPFFDTKTMEIHHQKHHQTYINNLNTALNKYNNLNYSLEEMLINLNLLPQEIRQTVNNNGGGHFNHSFFWPILKINYNKLNQNQSIIKAIEQQFNSVENFKDLFKIKGISLFGSGWIWLILNKETKLEIITTANQDNPLIQGKPILALDLWEHSYYLSYQNRRADYIEAFFNIINWEQVENNFQKILYK